jgi:hypothetical protein
MKLTNWHSRIVAQEGHQLDQVSRHRNQGQLVIGEFDPVDQIAFDFDEIVGKVLEGLAHLPLSYRSIVPVRRIFF